MALTDESPDWTPQDVFSPRRFLSKHPLFLSSKDNLWRIAQALCKRLIAVNEQISLECTYGATTVPTEMPEISTITPNRMTSQPGSTIKPDTLRDFPLFSNFSDRELRQLLRLMRRWDLPRGTVVVSEGGPGGSCFIIVSGNVDVTVACAAASNSSPNSRPAASSVRSASSPARHAPPRVRSQRRGHP